MLMTKMHHFILLKKKIKLALFIKLKIASKILNLGVTEGMAVTRRLGVHPSGEVPGVFPENFTQLDVG